MTERRRREPIFQIPSIIVAMIAFMALVQAAQDLGGIGVALWALRSFAFVPGSWTSFVDPNLAASSVARLDPQLKEQALFFAAGALPFWTPLTYAFLHAGWIHLGANSIWMAAFGAPVARRLGALRFGLLFCIASIGGAFAHWITHPLSFEPVVGASAGVSGLMAAAARFVFQPGGPIERASGERAPALSVAGSFTEPRALAFIVMWFGVNLAIGLAAQPLGVTGSPIAWEAHIGGFVAGLFVFSLLDPVDGDDGRTSDSASSELGAEGE